METYLVEFIKQHGMTGMMAVVIYMAVKVMDVLRSDLGLRVPDDISVIGFDDIAMAGLPTYDLTTIRQPTERMVEAALRILFRQIEAGTTDPEHVILGATLVERGSVAARHPR